ncbi:MAG TPA: hypothetical protein VK473_18250 [Terriglobales bacterium]|nr:hypothetical protein [Terriglobales bacterium]
MLRDTGCLAGVQRQRSPQIGQAIACRENAELRPVIAIHRGFTAADFLSQQDVLPCPRCPLRAVRDDAAAFAGPLPVGRLTPTR